MRGRDLDGAGPEFGVGDGIKDDRNRPVHERQLRRLPRQFRGAWIARMNRHGRVAEHGLRPRGRHHQLHGTPVHRISDVPQMALCLFVFHLEIGNGGLASGTPVHHVLASIDETFFVEADEGFAHCAGKTGVQSEALARPVATVPGALHLLDDAATVLPLPLPHTRLELLAAQVALVQSLFGELSLHHELRGDAGVVRSGEPQRRNPEHSPPAHLGVDDRMLEHVADVQRAGHVRRRNHQRTIRVPRLRLGPEKLRLHPPLRPVRFETLGFINLLDFHWENPILSGERMREDRAGSPTPQRYNSRHELLRSKGPC